MHTLIATTFLQLVRDLILTENGDELLSGGNLNRSKNLSMRFFLCESLTRHALF